MDEKGFYRSLRTLELLSVCERAVAAFYRGCAGAWPHEGRLWTTLASEEEQHAIDLERMHSLAAGNPGGFGPGQAFNPLEVRTLIEGLRRQTQRLREGWLGREAAHGIARELERSLIERRYHAVLVTGNREYARLLREILEQTADHAALLAAASSGQPLEAVFAR